jgi:hypothetical protein
VFYDQRNPGARCCIAHDPNSWELAFMMFVGSVPIVMGNTFRMVFMHHWRNMFPKRMRVRVVDHQAMAKARLAREAAAAEQAAAEKAAAGASRDAGAAAGAGANNK